MELDFDKPNIESSGNFESSFFGVSDLSIIFDIIRNKMYSSPIKAICREITCNARDAHREIGKPNEPIQICMPTFLDPFLKIKDFGPGISPERMKDVFINYAASTKRSDNTQTGGFGLGAKTPFSYSDTFNIITNVNGIKYHYSCYIDETKLGKLVLLNKESTKDSNGTEIIIPIKKHDEEKFQSEIIAATEFWDTKPIILNKEIEYPVHEYEIEGSCWKQLTTNTYGSANLTAVVDGIPYPINTSHINCNTKFLQKIKSSYYTSLLLYFNVGELVLSANREQIYLDDKDNKSQSCINKKLKICEEELLKSLEDKLNKEDSWWKAYCLFSDIKKKSSSLLGSLCPTWKGKDLVTNFNGIVVHNFTKNNKNVKDIKDLKSSDITKVNYSRTLNATHFFYNCAFTYCNDKGHYPTKIQALKVFKSNPFVDAVQIIVIDSSYADPSIIDSLKEKLNAEPYEKYCPSFKKKNKNADITFEAYLYVYSYDPIKKRFVKSSAQNFKNCKTKKVLCRMPKQSMIAYYEKEKSYVTIKNEKHDVTIINNLIDYFKSKNKEITFFAIEYDAPCNKVKKLFKKTTTLDKAIADYLNILNVDFNMVKAAARISPKYNFYSLFKDDNFNIKLIKNKNSKIVKALKFLEKMKSFKQYEPICDLYEKLNEPIKQTTIDKYISKISSNIISEKEIDKDYPLLKYIVEAAYYFDKDTLQKDIINYINLIDKGLNK